MAKVNVLLKYNKLISEKLQLKSATCILNDERCSPTHFHKGLSLSLFTSIGLTGGGEVVVMVMWEESSPVRKRCPIGAGYEM